MAESFNPEVLRFESKESDNPFALIVSNANSSEGEIKIEPPFTASDDWLRARGEEGVVQLKNLSSSQHATILSYEIPKRNKLTWTEQERLEITAGHLLWALGELASDKLFMNGHGADNEPGSHPIADVNYL